MHHLFEVAARRCRVARRCHDGCPIPDHHRGPYRERLHKSGGACEFMSHPHTSCSIAQLHDHVSQSRPERLKARNYGELTGTRMGIVALVCDDGDSAQP